MPLSIKLLVLVFGLVFLAIFISLLRKKSMKPFYSILWLLVAFFMLSLVVFEKFYKWIATTLGVYDATVLVIIGLILFLLMYVLHLSIKISEMSDRIQELISHTSILEHEIRKNNKKNTIK